MTAAKGYHMICRSTYHTSPVGHQNQGKNLGQNPSRHPGRNLGQNPGLNPSPGQHFSFFHLELNLSKLSSSSSSAYYRLQETQPRYYQICAIFLYNIFCSIFPYYSSLIFPWRQPSRVSQNFKLKKFIWGSADSYSLRKRNARKCQNF